MFVNTIFSPTPRGLYYSSNPIAVATPPSGSEGLHIRTLNVYQAVSWDFTGIIWGSKPLFAVFGLTVITRLMTCSPISSKLNVKNDVCGEKDMRAVDDSVLKNNIEYRSIRFLITPPLMCYFTFKLKNVCSEILNQV